MEDSENILTPSPSNLGERKQPVVLIAQLMRSAAQMRHVDEVFVWLSNAMIRYLDLPVVQFWVTELDNKDDKDGKDSKDNKDNKERFQADLRSIATQNSLLPQEVYLNNQVLAVVERLFNAKRSVKSLPIRSLFSPSQVATFALYDLHYWAGYFLDSDALLPPTITATVSKPKSVSLTVIVSLFTEAPLSADQMRAVNFVLKQAMRIIINKRFLTFQNSLGTSGTSKENPAKDPSIALFDIIPTRSQDVKQLQAVNPFAHASIIVDRKARRLYSAVDGCRDVAELARVTRLAQKELIEALRYLFQHKKIEFYTPEGEPVEHLPLNLSAS